MWSKYADITPLWLKRFHRIDQMLKLNKQLIHSVWKSLEKVSFYNWNCLKKFEVIFWKMAKEIIKIAQKGFEYFFFWWFMGLFWEFQNTVICREKNAKKLHHQRKIFLKLTFGWVLHSLVSPLSSGHRYWPDFPLSVQLVSLTFEPVK